MDKRYIFGAAGILLLVALAVPPLPSVYYTFLKIVVTVAGIIASFDLYKMKNKLWMVFAGLAVVFNPFILVYLTGDIRFLVYLAGAGMFGWVAWKKSR